MPKLSAGFKRDMLVLQFAVAVMKTARSPVDMAGLRDRDRSNRHHKTNARIDRRVTRLIAEADAVLDRIASTLFDESTGKWYRTQLQARLLPALEKAGQHTEVNLEMFGLYVLFVNFCERSTKLDNEFEAFTDPEKYFAGINLLKEAGIDDDFEAIMMREAYAVIAILKG